jgi:RNA polymerase sigma factor (sigma-70 family)
LTEANIIAGCLNNDNTCQRALYDRFRAQMYSVCLRYCPNDADAQEALQNGFIRVFRFLDRYAEQGQLGAWIRKIMVRASLDQIRANKKHQIAGDETTIDDSLHVDFPDTMTYEKLLQLLEELPEGYKIVFSMYVLDDYSHAEIAETLQINEATSRTQLFKARKMLQTKLAHQLNQFL